MGRGCGAVHWAVSIHLLGVELRSLGVVLEVFGDCGALFGSGRWWLLRCFSDRSFYRIWTTLYWFLGGSGAGDDGLEVKMENLVTKISDMMGERN